MLIYNDAIGIAPIGNASEVFVRRIESERHVWAELFEIAFAILARSIGVNHATHRNEIAWLVLGNGRTDVGYASNDLMAGDNRIVRRHELAPFIANRMQVRVTNATEKDFDLHIAVGGIASHDRRRGQQRRLTGSGIGLRFVSSWMHA